MSKLFGKSSRGYCGWFESYYYRSFIELLHIIKLKKENKNFQMEKKSTQKTISR